jgi:hypothetical protein
VCIGYRGQWFVQAAKEATAAKAASDAKAAADKVGSLRISLAAVSAMLALLVHIGHFSAVCADLFCYMYIVFFVIWYR